MDKFWINDPYVLAENYYEILPSTTMSRITQMNTVTRLFIYFLILCILFNANEDFILYILIGIILIIVFYYIYLTDPIGINNDLINENVDELEEFTDNCPTCDINNNILNKSMIKISDDNKIPFIRGSNLDVEIESGYLDSNGDFKIGPNYSSIDLKEYEKKEEDKKKKKVSWAKNQIFVDETCRKPSADNPFTNIAFTDYLDATNIAEPCNINQKNLTEMQNLYNSTIFRNTSDVFERENSQRLFYTMPIQSVPNDQTDFANWLYKTGPTCKENSQNCTYYQDPSMTSQRY